MVYCVSTTLGEHRLHNLKLESLNMTDEGLEWSRVNTSWRECSINVFKYLYRYIPVFSGFYLDLVETI